MKKILLFVASILAFTQGYAQITITAADMPVSGDTLRHSAALFTTTTINLADTGSNKTWHYDSLVATTQAVDTYKTAASVNPSFALTLPSGDYGYKVADSIPGISAFVSVSNIYTYFEKISSPNAYVADGFSANVSGFPLPSKYSDVDEWYFFPLTYLRSDSSTYAYSLTIPGLGSIKFTGYRKTRVVGWGSITTPYYTTAINVLMVRSETHEIDSVHYSTTALGIPRNTVDYKWIANGEHYPALWVTANIIAGGEKVTNVQYRDVVRHGLLSVNNTTKPQSKLNIYPNPATNGTVRVQVPADWSNYITEVFDMQGRAIATSYNTPEINVSSFASGHYIVRVSSGANIAFGEIVK